MKTTIHLLILACLLCLLVLGDASAQTKSRPTAKARVRERINAIINETLKRGEFTTPEGYRATTRLPPSNEDVEEVKRIGDDAILALEEHFSSPNGREYELAMRLMGALGGKRIIEPLRKIIQFDPSPAKRAEALRWITQGPWDLASEIISLSAKIDSDPHVREVAKELLSGYAP
jgi:hypothetical protein